MMMNMNKNKNKNKKKDRIDPCIIIIIIIVTHSFECRIKLDWPTWKKKHYNLLQHVYSVNTHTHTLIHKQLMFRWTGGFLLLNFSFKDFFLFLLLMVAINILSFMFSVCMMTRSTTITVNATIYNK